MLKKMSVADKLLWCFFLLFSLAFGMVFILLLFANGEYHFSAVGSALLFLLFGVLMAGLYALL